MKKIIFLLSAVLCVQTLAAQTLAECCRLARERYPAIRKYALVQQSLDYNLSNAARSWIPQVTFSAQASMQSEAPAFPKELVGAIGLPQTLQMDKDQYRIALDVDQKIWDGGTAAAQRRLARAEAEMGTASADMELYALEERVEGIYFGILLLDEKVKQLEAAMELLRGNLRKVQTCVENGTALSADADQLEVELLSAGQRLEAARASRNSYRQMLELLIGKQMAPGPLTRPAVPQLSERSSARHELALLDARTGKVLQEQQLAKSQVMPKFSAFAQGYYGYPGMDLFKSMSGSGLTFNALVGVRMAWNIGAFNTYRNRVRSLDAVAEGIQAEKDVFLFNSRLATVQEDGEIARLRKTLADDSRIVELRRNVRKTAEKQLENGVIDVTGLLKKITDETSATLGKCIHEIELLQANYKLKRILNR